MTMPDLPAPGPAATDRQLAAWRDAVTTAGLPDPSRHRWQVLRAGVVGLWEFDVAEYWFADGRAQFVGQNQSGKSTMMALTTLLMLAGSLDRKYVDTFGDSEKEYRYYVEPVADDRDRRDASTSTNRGWAWVEYGRIGPLGAPEFFTTMLYTQTKRGVKQMTRVWVVCHGTARVRDGLDLAAGQAVTEPKDLEPVDGVTLYPKGSDYTERLATDLFGFDDTERYATVIEMLKVLRTPHLGQKLDPAWFTSQIRSALPPIAKSEVTELANGWQELEQLARDRDHADEARKAITVYLNRAWRPWADAVLRLHADTLIAADTAVVKAAENATAAETRLGQARGRLDDETQNTTSLEKALERTRAELMQLLRSSAYTTAVERANDAKRLRADANAARERARKAAAQLVGTRDDLDTATARRDKTAEELGTAHHEVEAAAGHAVDTATAAGLGEHAPAWAAAGDVDRFDVAVTNRRGQVTALRKLIRTAARAAATWNTLDDLAQKAQTELNDRTAAATATESSLHQAVQTLSDHLERWAVALGEWSPPTGTRTQWITAVTDQTHAERPRELLTALLTRQWLEPVTAPLITRAADLRAAARTATKQAADTDAEADRLAAADDPIPEPPARWTRRDRPAFPTTAGAPLWRLLDPVDGLDPAILDHVEAALAAAGLLDTWVTPHGAWNPEHDGDDAVIITGALPAATTPLARILQPAEDAATLTDVTTKILNGIGYTTGGPLTAPVCLAADGRWRTPAATGRAAPAEHGAELIGTAARTATRRRKIADLRAQATAFRDEAERLTSEADRTTTQVTNLRDAAGRAPTDADVVAAAAAYTSAIREADKADSAYREARSRERDARTLSETAAADVTRYATDYQLPIGDENLDILAAALDTTAAAAGSLRLALRGLGAATSAATDAAERFTAEERRVNDATTLANDEAAAAERADTNATLAEQSVDADAQQLFAQAEHLERKVEEYGPSISASRREGLARSKEAGEAENAWKQRCNDLTAAREHRDIAAAAWWTPVDAGLTAARHLPTPESRDLPAALAHARTAAEQLRPPMWPDRLDDKAKRAEAALSRMLGSSLIDLRTVLETHGGRSVITTEADEQHPLPSVTLIVDASGTSLDPAEAILHLQKLVDDLSRTHDEKLHQMYTELLSSTFIDHLADRMKKVITLLKVVNDVLEKHPTGANKTTLRLRRVAAEGQAPGFRILTALLDGTIESEAAQQQIQLFLGARLREAQDAGLVGTEDWTDRLAELLDYRAWFDVVAQYRVGDGDENRWKDLTRKVHGVDSGGGKVVTLLQPLLATLVALYSESPDAPRPLWLDEAFEGVDPGNRATMMRMLTDFDLDFLLAGPAPLVAVAQVPAAAVWVITRAPAPVPGVDLSLMLWAGRTLEQIPVGDYATRLLTPRRTADDPGPDLFATMLADPVSAEPRHTNGSHHADSVTEEASDTAVIAASEPA
ncbi:SbcC/MukB-like Walker B domain-containing protein [Actinoplanes sp. NEAU-A12]|uniref:SbcC/MukB-like Walker B domain-containing protein n=1 Tax=Actinoplanes sandaracinus TaxID=3045177 RepID=A0ABT6WWM9_9ACTN|nr:SbcC/MukB-like Walker B domain-containing protein [Actinoplanes sandaracinus]MDI6104154.1 SbcC/MukB-like Walker B domain-containing protein [Actinoplanes sandaracinus]